MWKQTKAILRRAGSRLRHDRAALSVFLFHALFSSDEEISRELVVPQQRITVDRFRRFLQHYHARGYRFVGPDEVLAKLPPGDRCAMITFDDGYRNNLRALPLLREFGAPATFFVATSFVRSGHAFWWDAIYRELRRSGASTAAIARERAPLKSRPLPEIEEQLLRRFGAGALEPAGEEDRPLTPADLAALTREPLAHFGNHTADHALLGSCDASEVAEQIARGQRDLEEIAGCRPRVIAYPSGSYDAAVIGACRAAGLELGITVERRKEYLPLGRNPARLMRLGRFTLWGQEDIDSQCEIIRSDFSWRGLRGARKGEGEGC